MATDNSIALSFKTIGGHLPVWEIANEERSSYERLVKKDATECVKDVVANFATDLKVQGRTEQFQNLAHVPWVGIHDARIDSKAKTGVYVAILFAVDGKSVALSLQIGTDSRGSRQDIRTRARQLREDVLLPDETFVRSDIDLGSGLSTSKRPANYEVANIIGKSFDLERITDEMIERDLRKLLHSYEMWVHSIIASDSDAEETYQAASRGALESPITDEPSQRNKRGQYRPGTIHPPRSKAQGEEALRRADYRCELDRSHETFQLESGKQYMEKHHLIPMSKYWDKQFERTIDHFTNIFSLCPTCHRKIHSGCRTDRKMMARTLFQLRGDALTKMYGVTEEEVAKFY